jgi:hypothetical protein
MGIFDDIRENASQGYSTGYSTGQSVVSGVLDVFGVQSRAQEFPSYYEDPTSNHYSTPPNDGLNIALAAVGLAVLFLIAKG